MSIRTCKTCGQDKPIDAFPARYGRSAHLRDLTCGVCRKHRYRSLNPDQYHAARREQNARRHAKAKGMSVEQYKTWQQDRKINAASKNRGRLVIDKIVVKKNRKTLCPLLSSNYKTWYRVNAEKRKAQSRNFYWQNRNKERSRIAKWKAVNQGLVSQQRYRRRSRFVGLENSLTHDQWLQIKAAYRHRCAYCGRRKPLTMDHIVPVVSGGSHTSDNIIPACQSCNSSKGSKPPLVSYQPHLIC